MTVKNVPSDHSDNDNNEYNIDTYHTWHPYTSMPNIDVPCYVVEKASGVELTIRPLSKSSTSSSASNNNTINVVDGMSSWWACIHGYNNNILNHAIINQLQNSMSHIMFGGLTHIPSIELTKLLLSILPKSLQHIFYCDSGSVAIEIAMKISIQYWYNLHKDNKKSKFVTIRGGYHGDTFMAMSVCDPNNGMHYIFHDILYQQYFIERPTIKYHDDPTLFNPEIHMNELRILFDKHHSEIAAMILEPIVQGAGGMYFYSSQYLKHYKALCNEYNILLIYDEIATGFGRTGTLWGYQHASTSNNNNNNNNTNTSISADDDDIVPDIMCIGKALSGGYMSFAATITNSKVANQFSNINNNTILMHGPTYMGNPLACVVSKTSIELLLNNNWKNKVNTIEKQLKNELLPCIESSYVKDVRVLGAIGVIEMKENINVKEIQSKLLHEHNVWLRPFGKLLYTMPPFMIISSKHITQITKAMISIAFHKKI